jgi:hypothetical protein
MGMVVSSVATTCDFLTSVAIRSYRGSTRSAMSPHQDRLRGPRDLKPSPLKLLACCRIPRYEIKCWRAREVFFAQLLTFLVVGEMPLFQHRQRRNRTLASLKASGSGSMLVPIPHVWRKPMHGNLVNVRHVPLSFLANLGASVYTGSISVLQAGRLRAVEICGIVNSGSLIVCVRASLPASRLSCTGRQ